jgi:carbonic anhydrase/acetyltransferase-like protein (isoleucine patch superfamily)
MDEGRLMTAYNTTFRPEQVHPSVFIAPGAVIVGDVTLGEDSRIKALSSGKISDTHLWSSSSR